MTVPSEVTHCYFSLSLYFLLGKYTYASTVRTNRPSGSIFFSVDPNILTCNDHVQWILFYSCLFGLGFELDNVLIFPLFCTYSFMVLQTQSLTFGVQLGGENTGEGGSYLKGQTLIDWHMTWLNIIREKAEDTQKKTRVVIILGLPLCADGEVRKLEGEGICLNKFSALFLVFNRCGDVGSPSVCYEYHWLVKNLY